MARKVIRFNRGSARRLKQIRWKISELTSLAMLTILMIVTMLFVVFWELHHEHPYSDPSKHPQIRDAKPTQP